MAFLSSFFSLLFLSLHAQFSVQFESPVVCVLETKVTREEKERRTRDTFTLSMGVEVVSSIVFPLQETKRPRK